MPSRKSDIRSWPPLLTTIIIASVTIALVLAASVSADGEDAFEFRADDERVSDEELEATDELGDDAEVERRGYKSEAVRQLYQFYPHRDRLTPGTYLPIDGSRSGGGIPEAVKNDISSLLDDHSVDAFLREALQRVDVEDAFSRLHGVADVHASQSSTSLGHHGHLRGGKKWNELDRYARIWQYTAERWLQKAGKDRSQTFKEALLRLLDAYYRQRGNSTSVDTCPASSGAVPACSVCSPYRTADGTCNNLRHTRYGMAGAPLERFAPSVYEDGIAAPRVTAVGGAPLPSARKVSTTVISRGSNLSDRLTHMVMQWAQFVDHDFTSSPMIAGDDGIGLACCVDEIKESMRLSDAQAAAKQLELNARYGCFNIPVPDDDPFFTDRKCMGFSRSTTVPQLDCKLGQRSPVNKLTAYVDGSMVYGSTQQEQNDLRSFTNGRLKTLDVPGRQRSLPPQKPGQGVCNKQSVDNECLTAGDDRINEQPGLLSIHTVLVREHNRVAAELKKLNPSWNDENVFQETRKIVAGEIQHITFNKFLPIILGPGLYEKYDLKPTSGATYYTGYNEEADATVRTEFSSVAFRFGHTLIRDSFTQGDTSFKSIGSFELRNHYFSPDFAYNSSFGVSTVLRGLLSDPAENFDHRITTQVTDHLFETGHLKNTPLDLIALNIQRAREHGIPSYVSLRKILGMSVPKTFDDLRDTHADAIIDRFRAVYANVEDIDAFPGGVSERSLPGAVLGPFFGKIVALQFALAKTGDRFYYENDCRSSFGSCGLCNFTPAQLLQIKKATLSRLLCDNADIPNIRINAFEMRSRLVSCDSLPALSFEAWRESK